MAENAGQDEDGQEEVGQVEVGQEEALSYTAQLAEVTWRHNINVGKCGFVKRQIKGQKCWCVLIYKLGGGGGGVLLTENFPQNFWGKK